MFKKAVFSLLVLTLGGMTGCFRPVIPISTRPQYPIDVFFDHETVDRPYTELQVLTLSEETPLSDREKRAKDRLLTRGNDLVQKDLLVAKLVVEAQKLGADALVRVKYQVYTTEKATGYSMEGLAVKYRGD
jgi:hypothetical protein